MNTSRKLIAALVAGVSLAGIGSYAAADGKKSSELLDVTQVQISQNQAVDIALQNVPGTVRSTEFDSDKDMKLWEVEIIDSTGQAFDVEINANTGEVVSQKADEADEDGGGEGDEDGEGDDDGERDNNEPENEQQVQNNA